MPSLVFLKGLHCGQQNAQMSVFLTTHLWKAVRCLSQTWKHQVPMRFNVIQLIPNIYNHIHLKTSANQLVLCKTDFKCLTHNQKQPTLKLNSWTGDESFEDFVKSMGLGNNLGAAEQDILKKLTEDRVATRESQHQPGPNSRTKTKRCILCTGCRLCRLAPLTRCLDVSTTRSCDAL